MPENDIQSNASAIPFFKMDGTGNMFVIIDARERKLPPLRMRDFAARVAKPNNVVTGGCDQLIIIEPSARADCRMRIFNADGSESGACGNATRCVAWWLARPLLPGAHFFQQVGTSIAAGISASAVSVTIETKSGILSARVQDPDNITVDMGRAITSWRGIPLSSECDTSRLPIEKSMLHEPAAVNMGNPHMVFFVPDVNKIPLETLGPELERHPLYPERANVSVASIDGREITLRVWERGAGLTQACGTAACAAFVAAKNTGRLEDFITGTYVHLPGGSLFISITRHNDHIMMKGPVRYHFAREIPI